MAAYVEQRHSSASWWCRRIANFSVIVAAIGIGAHRFGFLETEPFLYVLATVLALVILALLLAASGFQRVWHRGDRGGGDLTFGIMVSLAVLAPFAFAAFLAVTRPPLVDISTDNDDPPPMPTLASMRSGAANSLGPPTPQAAAMQAQAYPTITGRRYAVTAEQTLGATETLLDEWGWELVSPTPTVDQVETVIEAVARLPVLAIPYDLAVRVTDEGNATYVDMRSAARYGSRDLGVNAYLIDSFLTELDKRVAAMAGLLPEE